MYIKRCRKSRGIPRGSWFENVHLSPESRRRRRKGNPVPVGIIRLPCTQSVGVRGRRLDIFGIASGTYLAATSENQKFFVCYGCSELKCVSVSCHIYLELRVTRVQ
jgi:hypothetical protein